MSGVVSPAGAASEDITEEEDEDEEMEVEVEVARDADCVVEQSVALLNDKEFVSFLVGVAETSCGAGQGAASFPGGGGGGGAGPVSVLRQVCVTCHQLLLHHPQVRRDCFFLGCD